MAGWHHQCNGHELRQTSGDGEEQVCCSLCSPKETERLHFHFSLSCTGAGNGNPLQCSCLENPRDQGAWWAAVYGVAQSRTRLKRLSSSNSSSRHNYSSPLNYAIQLCVCSDVQSCLTLCDPTDCGPPGSSVHEILQATILEWVAMPSSRGSSLSRVRT